MKHPIPTFLSLTHTSLDSANVFHILWTDPKMSVANFCRSIVLDYDVHIAPLRSDDRTLIYGNLGNYSLAGFEMILHRYVSHYIITYYLPSGKGSFALHDETMWYRTHDSLITFNNGLGPLKTKSGGGFRGRGRVGGYVGRGSCPPNFANHILSDVWYGLVF